MRDLRQGETTKMNYHNLKDGIDALKTVKNAIPERQLHDYDNIEKIGEAGVVGDIEIWLASNEDDNRDPRVIIEVNKVTIAILSTDNADNLAYHIETAINKVNQNVHS